MEGPWTRYVHHVLYLNLLDPSLHSKDPDNFWQDLTDIAKTTLSFKVLTQDKEHSAKLAVNAVLRLMSHWDMTNTLACRSGDRCSQNCSHMQRSLL
jgi:hypothetical protein